MDGSILVGAVYDRPRATIGRPYFLIVGKGQSPPQRKKGAVLG